jgi:hypothetical protein
VFKIKYLVGTDIRTIEVDVSISEIQSFVQTIRNGGGKILSVHRQEWKDVTDWASKTPGKHDYNWITNAKEVAA